jgi:hypothetical protein
LILYPAFLLQGTTAAAAPAASAFFPAGEYAADSEKDDRCEEYNEDDINGIHV